MTIRTEHAAGGQAKGGQILSLNALRGLAAVLVVLSHLHEVGLEFGPSHIGSFGVMVFFTLSGFLMGLLYLGQPAGWHQVSRYAVARFSRIAPPYLIVVVSSFFIYTLVDPRFPYALDTHNIVRHLFFSGNVSVFWSIPPEVQFYALFIALWWAVRRAVDGRTGALIVVVALAVLAISLRDKVPGTFAFSKLHFFLMGALLGGLHPWLRRVPISTKALTLLQVVLLGSLGLFMLDVIHLPQKYWHDLGPALISGLVVFAFAHDRTPIDAAFSARPFQWLGDWSFSVYLVHVPVLYVLAKFGLTQPGLPAVVGVVLTLAVCAAFSIFVEHPACAATKGRLTALLKRLDARLVRREPVPLAAAASGMAAAETPTNAATAAPLLAVSDITSDRTSS